MPIIFYSMKGCGFCTKAQKMFAEELANGEIIMKPSNEAPKSVRGFPTFSYKNKLHSGLPSSKEELYIKLKYSKEDFCSMYRYSRLGHLPGHRTGPHPTGHRTDTHHTSNFIGVL